jgi:hypothetical protein
VLNGLTVAVLGWCVFGLFALNDLERFEQVRPRRNHERAGIVNWGLMLVSAAGDAVGKPLSVVVATGLAGQLTRGVSGGAAALAEMMLA